MSTATFLRRLPSYHDGRLYKLDPPAGFDYDFEEQRFLQTTEHVLVSAVVHYKDGPETYIFPARPDGTLIQSREMKGSARGYLDHDQVLRNAGYEPVYPVPVEEPEPAPTLQELNLTSPDPDTLVTLLEVLLSITEPFKSQLNPSDRVTWQSISAATADARMILDGGNPETDV